MRRILVLHSLAKLPFSDTIGIWKYIQQLGLIKILIPVQDKVYVLYARKSTESEERQVLSIDSQVKEMLQLAEREDLEVVEIRKESHSAKESGQRPVCWR